MVHDVRNSLAVVTSNLEYLSTERDLGATAKAAIEDSLAAGRRMARQLESSLDLARLERGERPLRLAPVELGGLLHMLADRYLQTARRARLKISVSATPRLRASLDLDLILRVLSNIADNAVRYTRSGGEIRLSARSGRDDTHHEIRVANNGEPISRELRAQLLECPAASPVPRSQSRDVGLYFGRLALEAHGGRLRFDEEPGYPVVFVLEVPRAA